MTVEIGPVNGIALLVAALAASALLVRFFSWWGRSAALARARRIAARLRHPATTLAEVEDQSAAIEELVQFDPGEAAVVVAQELLHEKEPAVRSAAVEILRRTRALDNWARDLHRAGYRGKLRAIHALGQVGDERAVAELIEVLGDDDPGVARAASRAVLARDPDYAADRLAEALSSPNRRTAETAAATLVHLGGEAIEALVSQLASLSAQARRLGVESLGAIGRPELAALLTPLLETEPEAQVRASAAEALARVGGELAWAELRRLAQSDPDWFVRGRAYTLMAESNAPGAAAFLIDALEGLQPQISAGSDQADAIEVVDEGARRLQAAITVGLRILGLSDHEIVRAVRSAEESDPSLLVSPGEGETANGWPQVVAALGEPDAARRADAARQLAEAGPPAASGLRRALRDPDPLVRCEAARSLGRIGASDCLDALAECLRDPDASVRLASSAAMRLIVNRDAARELQE